MDLRKVMNYKLFLISIFIALVLFVFSNHASAQRVKPNRWLVSADGGVSVFFGDVKRYEYMPDHKSPSEIQAMFSFNVGKELSSIINIRGQFLYGNISGHKQKSKYNFKGSTIGGHLFADFNLIYLLTNERFGRSRINAFASLGFGYISWDSKLYYDVPKPDGTELMAESNSGALSFPGSLSLEYMFSKSFSVNANGYLYVVNSDELDAKPGGIKVDMINYYSVGLAYRFKAKRKASRRKINYRLAPELYEPIPKVKSESEDSEVKEVLYIVEDVEVNNEDYIVADSVIAIDEVENKVVAQNTDDYVIDHELEREAIDFEAWASSDEDPWPEIYFSVQIVASRDKLDTRLLSDKYSLSNNIIENYDGVWYRYSIGQYDKVWRAKELRNLLRSRNRIEDAFIVVYHKGERISLEEALGIQSLYQANKDKQEERLSEAVLKKIYPLVHLEHNIPQEGLFIGVQILSLQEEYYPLGALSGIYGIQNTIYANQKGSWYKLIAADLQSLEEAMAFARKARNKGFIDASVVAFKDGKRISISTLKSLTNGQ